MSSVKAICLAALFVLTPLFVLASTLQEGALPQQQQPTVEMTAAEILSGLKLVTQDVDIKRTFELLAIGLKVHKGEKVLSSAEHKALTDEVYTRLGSLLDAVGVFIRKYDVQPEALEKAYSVLPGSMVTLVSTAVEVSQYDVTPLEKGEALMTALGGGICDLYLPYLGIALLAIIVSVILTGPFGLYFGVVFLLIASAGVFVSVVLLMISPYVLILCLFG